MSRSFKSPPTSSEVARRAGVSRTTVSFVLNDVRNQGISETTRERVLAAARELAYEPHAAARSLAGGSTSTVGLVIPKAWHLHVDVFIGQLVATVNEICSRHELKLLIEAADDGGGFVNLATSRRIDGLIVVSPRTAEVPHLKRLRDTRFPLVVLGSSLPEIDGFHTVGSDTGQLAQQAVGHLISLGHRRIAYVSFAQPEFHAVNQREQGWRDALALHGISVDPAWLEYADITAASGYLATQRLLARGASFTALFAGNDTIAFGALKALREAKLRVPQDIAVMGYDDIPLAEFANPPLSTVQSDPIGHGEGAMAKLLAQMTGDALDRSSLRALQTSLVIRESCGAKRG